MTLVYSILLTALTILAVTRGNNAYSTKLYIDKDGYMVGVKNNLLIFGVAWMVFTFLMGNRQGFVDTATYKKMCTRIGTDFNNLQNPRVAIIEPGFNLWMLLCNLVSNSNSQFFVLVTTAFTLALAFKYIYDNSEDGALSIYYFVVFYSFTFMNGIRQAFVAVIFPLLHKRWRDNWIAMVLGCVLLSFFHRSVLLMIPIYLCTKGGFFNWKVRFVFIFALMCFLVPNRIQSLFNAILSERYNESLTVSTSGAGIHRVIVNTIPVLMLVLYRRIARGNEMDAEIHNIFLIDFAINVCSLRSTYFARMSIYFAIFIVVYYPVLLKKVFNYNSQRIAHMGFTVFYSAFYLYQASTFENYGYLGEFYIYFMQ